MSKRILIVMSGYFPGRKYGGPPVSVDNFCSLLKGEVECYILAHDHDMGETARYENIHDGWNDRGNAKVKYLPDSEYGSRAFEAAIKEIRPDYIYLQSLFSQLVPSCLRLAKKHGIEVVLAPRGELCAGAFKKKYKKLPYIWMFRMLGLFANVHFQSTSEEETKAIERILGVGSDHVHLLTNVPSIPHGFSKRAEKQKGKGRFVFISRILWKKNLLLAVKLMDGVKGDVQFDIYGPKEDESYWKECETAISELPPNVTVNYCGVLSHDDIHKTFNQYDAFLFPTLSENYGHVIAEALVTGCIPIISNQTPWNDMNEAGGGWVLPLAEEKAFVEAIQKVVDMDDQEIGEKRVNVEKYLEKKMKLDELKPKYLEVFK